MNNFLDRHQVPNLNQDQINDLNSPISPKEIETVINNLSTKKANQTNKQTKKNNLERAHTSSLTTHLKALEKKEENSPKRSRWQEIIKLRPIRITENKGKNQQNQKFFL